MSDLVKRCVACGYEHPSTRNASCGFCESTLYMFNKGQQKWVELPSITVFTSPDAKSSIPFIPNVIEVISVGRGESNIVMIDNPQVSVNHALITCDARGCTISGCGSQAGSVLNGRGVVDQILKDGDEIKIGNTVLQFVGPGDR